MIEMDELEEDFDAYDVYASDWEEDTPRDEVILFEDDEDRENDKLPRDGVGRITHNFNSMFPNPRNKGRWKDDKDK